MLILPVLDIKNGVVVRGVGGRRDEYRPIASRLTTSCKPIDVGRAFEKHFGLNEFYLADLAAIGGAAPALDIYADLMAAGYKLWVDAGVREPARARLLDQAGSAKIIIGLETLDGPGTLVSICRDLGCDRIAFSLDLKEGKPLGQSASWRGHDAWSIAKEVIGAGVRKLIVLDLARVGGGAGTGTDDLSSRLAAAYPDVDVIVGGGIRDLDDVRRLESAGIRGVLIASALHDGQITREWKADESNYRPFGI